MAAVSTKESGLEFDLSESETRFLEESREDAVVEMEEEGDIERTEVVGVGTAEDAEECEE